MAAHSAVNKLQQLLARWIEKYPKLRSSKYHELSGDNIEDTFASQLLFTVGILYNSETFSDIKIKLSDRKINAHKFVLHARSKLWNESILSGKSELDWTGIEPDVAEAIILWLYKDTIEFQSEDLTLKLIRRAFEFKLDNLVKSCEQYLCCIVTMKSCVKFYSVAEEVNAENLREYCSGLISTHWDDLNESDFEHMSELLLYQMLEDKTQFPLHAAVKLQREDVLILCLVENFSKLPDIVNAWSPDAELPLELALRNKNASIASTLVQHNADIDIRDAEGDTLLHRAIKREDSFSALFLLDNNCNAALSTRSENDSPLHLVAGAPSLQDGVKIAEKLINKNVNVNAQSRLGYTALHIAIQADNRPLFDLLLQQPSLDANLKTVDEHVPLYYALLKYELGDNGDDSYASTLVTRGVQTGVLYSNTDSLLQILIGEGASNAAVYLCDHLTNINHVNSKGETALHFASCGNDAQVVDKLLTCGANPNLLTEEFKQSPLHYAVTGDAVDAIKVFLRREDCGTNFEARDSNGKTPIMLAFNLRRKEVVPLLMEVSEVNGTDENNSTVRHQAKVTAEPPHQKKKHERHIEDKSKEIEAFTENSSSSKEITKKLKEPLAIKEPIVPKIEEDEEEEQVEEESSEVQEESPSSSTSSLKVEESSSSSTSSSEVKWSSLSKSERTKVENALSGNLDDVVVVHKFGINLNGKDIKAIFKQEMLDANVINFYMKLIIERGTDSEWPRSIAMDTTFYAKLTGKEGLKSVKEFTMGVDIFSYEFICVPIYLYKHWGMAIINLKKQTVKYYDRTGKTNKRCLQAFQRFLKNEYLAKKGEDFNVDGFKLQNMILPHSQQKNEGDCGIFSCTFAEFATRKAKFTFQQKDMKHLQEKMVVEIVVGHL